MVFAPVVAMVWQCCGEWGRYPLGLCEPTNSGQVPAWFCKPTNVGAAAEVNAAVVVLGAVSVVVLAVAIVFSRVVAAVLCGRLVSRTGHVGAVV